MEEPRRLAETVPQTLFLVAYKATVAGGLLHRIAKLHADLSAFAAAIHADLSASAAAIRADGAPPAADIDRPDLLFGSFPTILRELIVLCRLYVNASRTFVLAGASLGFNHGPIWRMWRNRRTDTLRCLMAALRRLRVARQQARRLVGAFVVAQTYPHESLGWLLWMAHSRRFATHAAVAVAMLFDASRRLRDAAASEFIAAWMILNRDGM